jgi:hypothetical protein
MMLGMVDIKIYIDYIRSIAAFPPIESGPLIIHRQVVVFGRLG